MNPVDQQPKEQIEENDDFDPFEAIRPVKRTMNNKIRDQDIDLKDDIADEIDYFQDIRPKQTEVDEVKKNKSKPKEKPTITEYLKDYYKQFGKGVLIGAGGTWGDLAELAGSNKVGPEQSNKRKRESDILDKINSPEYTPSFSELSQLSDDEDILAGNFKLPTSKNLEKLNEKAGGPGDPETPVGSYGKRVGKLLGSGAAFGQFNPIPAVLAGVAGQAVEDFGGNELLQTGAEIAALLLSPGETGKRVLQTSLKANVRNKINDLRNLGYTEEEITLAINHASKGKRMGVKASKGSKTEQAFENFIEHSNEMVSDILTSEIPGIDRGTQHVHQMASDAYGEVAQEGSRLNIPDSTPFINAATGVVRELRRNLGRNPEAETFLNRLYDAVIASTQNPSAENYMNFYKELNKAGDWMSRSQKDRLLTQVKNGIVDTFRSEGRQGRQLADRFERVNLGIRRAYQAEEAHDLIQKTVTQQGIDFKKLNKLFDKPDNVHLFEAVLGTQQTRNLNLIAKTGKEIKDFDKAYKATSLLTGTPTSIASNIGYLIYSGDWMALAASKGLEAGARKLAEKSLTDPKFQSLLIKGLHAIKTESPKIFRSVNESMQKYFDDHEIDINLTKR